MTQVSGIEWLIEVFGCSEFELRDTETLARLFDTLVSSLQLKPVGEAVWHRFPGSGGVTGIWLLEESHLTIHTFPEFRSLCLNVFCCRERQALNWKADLARLLGASDVEVRECRREYCRHA